MKNRIYIILLILIFSQLLFSQQTTESLKRQALVHMQAGRYGEAIDQLHKYIAANPRQSEGYNLRGLCYEQREEYQYAVLDFRRAVRLTPDNEEYKKNLNRVLSIWHKLLYEKIEGHKREIVIDPNNPVNYLEIGKSYRWLEEWALAEQWYDEYLRRDDNAVPDEIIRYTEILSKTGSIEKGEKILKKYVERYPDDWRLWSRYGYFTMWLGNYKNAQNAFETALGFKPFFKEAQDGLDLSKNEGYLAKQTPRSFERVYPIDRYYKLVEKKPEDVEIRYKLINELMQAKRYEEAYQQLIQLSYSQADTDRYNNLSDKLQTIRDSLYENSIQEYSAKIKTNPQNKEFVSALADAYGNLYAFEDAIEILDEYLEDVPENEELDMRYKLAQYSAWNYEWEKAIAQTNILLDNDPNNIDYLLLRGQIASWTVQNLDEGEEMLLRVLDERPRDLNAILALASINAWQKDFEEAKKYVDLAKEISPNSPEVEEAESNYLLHVSANEELKLFQMKADAAELQAENRCDEALELYDEYLSKITGPNREELKQYASINLCAQHYKDAINVFDELLNEEYDFDLDLRRAEAYLWDGDSTKALEEFKRLAESNPEDFYVNLYLADAYFGTGDYGQASDIYDELLDVTEEPDRREMINQRIGWLPPMGLEAGIDFITPTYIGLSPQFQHFSDNQNLSLFSYGSRVDFGFFDFLSLGATLMRTSLSDQSQTEYLTRMMGNMNIRFNKNITLDCGYGNFTTSGENDKKIYYLTGRYVEPEKWNLSAGYEHTDARVILYSPYLLNTGLYINAFRFSGEYIHKNLFKIQARYNYYSIEDSNLGNDLLLSFGKRFLDDGYFGYEYYFIDYAYASSHYYSPQEIESHSLWGEWELEKKEKLKINIGGKIGYFPSFDFLLSDIHGQIQYIPFDNFTLNGRVSFGSSYRYDSNYNSYSVSLSAYWNIY